MGLVAPLVVLVAPLPVLVARVLVHTILRRCRNSAKNVKNDFDDCCDFDVNYAQRTGYRTTD